MPSWPPNAKPKNKLKMSEEEIILTHILQCRRTDLLVHKPRLSSDQEKQLQEYKARRAKGEPLQYILGCWEFYGLEFKVDRRVLVPRPETEVLVDLAVKKFQGASILDLGTGSGNIAVALAKFLPYTKVTAVDISIDALALAMDNAQRHGVEGRVALVNEDMTTYLKEIASRPLVARDDGEFFDMIISNPPYISSGQMSHLPKDVRQEPALALDGGEDGLKFYRDIIKYSPGLLRAGGCLMMEFGDGQAKAVQALFAAQAAFSDIEIHKDLTGRERVIHGKICH